MISSPGGGGDKWSLLYPMWALNQLRCECDRDHFIGFLADKAGLEDIGEC